MSIQSLAMDLIALAIVAACAAFYARRGFIAGIFGLFGTLAAIVLAALAARRLAPILFGLLFRPGLVERMQAAIAGGGAQSLSELLASALGFLPEELLAAVAGNLGAALDFAAPDIAEMVADQVVAPMVLPLIAAVLFFLLFGLVRVLLGLVQRMAVGLGRLPVISTVNGLLGAAAGACVGSLYVFLGLCAVFAHDALYPAAAFGPRYFSTSIVYTLLSRFNFIAGWL